MEVGLKSNVRVSPSILEKVKYRHSFRNIERPLAARLRRIAHSANTLRGGNNFIIRAHGLIQRQNLPNERPPMVAGYTRKPESRRREKRTREG